MISTLRPSTIKYHLKQKHCSNCRETGHTIRYCDDIFIEQLHTLCKLQSEILTEPEFIIWINKYKLPLLKALCIRDGLFISNLNKDLIIKSLLEEYYMEQRLYNLLLLFNQTEKKIKLTLSPIKDQEKDQEKEKECPICYEVGDVTYNCNHSICTNCLSGTMKSLQSNQQLCCSLCRTEITHICSNTIEIQKTIKSILSL
jgi:hypothetical protein